jgi:hypothetical protein
LVIVVFPPVRSPKGPAAPLSTTALLLCQLVPCRPLLGRETRPEATALQRISLLNPSYLGMSATSAEGTRARSPRNLTGHTEPMEEGRIPTTFSRRSGATHGAPEPLGGRQQRAEDAGSIVVLRGERDRLLQELEQQRLRIEYLEAELGRRRSPWYGRWFG